MSVVLNLDPYAEQILREKAARSGLSLERYLEGLAEREARTTNGTTPTAAPAEFERRLDELAEGLPSLPTLPGDFSRADIYAERD